MFSTVHLGTFDAERWWRPADLAELPAVGMSDGRSVASMDELLAAFCAPGDLLITRAPMAAGLTASLAAAGIDFTHHYLGPDVDAEGDTAEALVRRDPALCSDLRSCRSLAPYAVLPDTSALAGYVGHAQQLPAAGTAAEVNSKVWSNAVATDLGVAGTATVVRSTSELIAEVSARDGAAVVKDPFGVSGKGMLEIDNARRLQRIGAALDRQCADGRRIELLVQDRYECRTNFSTQLTVGSDGTVDVLGVQVMRNVGFRYAGSAPASAGFVRELTKRGYFETVAAVGERLVTAGYRGPVGIDSALLVDDTLIPVFEVNARRSMGLLCLTLDRRFGEFGLTCRLVDRTLRVAPGLGIDDVVDALHRHGLEYDGGDTPGVLVLAGSTLSAPSGRVHMALLDRRDADPADLSVRVTAALATRGFTTPGVQRAV
ncbi:hypothetical protein AB0M36_07700 [Actinoplanes sp. NPDC051346]|uniref:hypothetical protein n=1 Tax=Actinoplanes sp. NPDC051346 TaxID=3155048 RepID=UPI00341379A0